MKKILLVITAAALLSGCASYQASSLAVLDPSFVKEYPELEGVEVGCKELSVEDCEVYLGRNVIKKGIRPIQLTFNNTTDRTYLFSANQTSLDTMSSQDVADRVHTSTGGRIGGYAVGSLVVPLLLIPAVVDGIRSYEANTQLDMDYDRKARDNFAISPHSFNKTILFIPSNCFKPTFELSLIEEGAKGAITFQVTATR